MLTYYAYGWRNYAFAYVTIAYLHYGYQGQEQWWSELLPWN